MTAKLLKPILGLLLCITTNMSALAQYNMTDVLPLNPKVITGKLPNGLTYYILPNAKPEKKVELRLVINTGSVNEDDDQLGLAHMCEHMAFNGTKNFKKNDIVSFLQDIGVQFGGDLNANTGFDRTLYILPIPTDKVGNLEKGFQVLEDWAHQVSYNTEDIEGERQIILEESRLGKGADDRMQQKWLPIYFNGSRYANRLPIGKDSIITNFKPDVIRRYYKEWYRPDIMAVVVVGDITKEKGLELVNKHFAGIKPVANPKVLEPITFPAYAADKAIILTDKESTGYRILMGWSAFKDSPAKTIGEYKNSLVESLFNSMLGARFREITQKPNPPFVFAGGSFGGFVKGFNQFFLQASTGTSDPTKAVSVLIQEVERVKQFGFLETELERAKKNLASNYESAFKNKDKTESDELTDELVALFNEGEPAPGIDNEFEYVKKLIPEIKLSDIATITDRFKNEGGRFYNITGPEKAEGFTLLKEDVLIALAKEASMAKVTPYEEAVIAKNLLSKEPKAGKVVKKLPNAKLGTTDLTLSNGVTITLKSTDFKDDEIVLSASRLGGSSNYGLKDKNSAQYASPIQAAMGYGTFAPQDLTKALSGKKVNAGGFFTETRDGFSGSSTVKDLETMFQLLHLKVTDQRKDTALFSSFVKKQKSQVAMMMANPQAAFIDTLLKFAYNNNELAPSPFAKPADFDKINLDRSQQIFRERLGDVTGMHFVIVGSFKEAEMIPLLEKYIASLPASGKKTTFVDRKVRTIRGNQTLEIKKGKEQKSLILQMYNGEVAYSQDLAMKAEALTEAMNIKIIEELREKVQGIYGGGIYGGLQKEPYPSYSMMAQLPTGPEKVDTLLKALKIEIQKVQKNGPDQSTLDKVKKQWIEGHREDLKKNGSWATELLEAKVSGNNIDRFINYDKYVNALTTKDIQKAAQVFLNPANMITGVQQPEKIEAPKPVVVNGRTTKVAATYDITDIDVTIDVYDNAQVDGDQISLFFNGGEVANKQNLTDKPLTFKVKARKGTNTIVMFAENLGTTPPNTAYMVVKAGGKEYKVELSSDLKESGSIVLNFK
jgi:zinc protease